MGRVDADHRYESAGVVRRWARHVVTWGPIAWLSVRLLPDLDRLVARLTSGRLTLSGVVTGLPVVELVTTGARTGAERRSRVLGIPIEDGFVIVAANFGEPVNPGWFHNLVARPEAGVVVDGRARAYRARVLAGAEREAGLALAFSLNPGWRRFQQRAGSRSIPVVELKAAGMDQ